MKVELSDEEKALMYRKLELSDLTDRNLAMIFFRSDVWGCLASDDLDTLSRWIQPSSDIQNANEKMNDG